MSDAPANVVSTLTKTANVLLNTQDTTERAQPMERVTIQLPGKPAAKGRPRFTKTGRAYTDAKTRAAEQSILAAWLVQEGSRPAHAGPISIRILAVFEPPQSWPKWRRDLALAGEIPHTTKPDFDNLAKVIDGLNGRAWVDDSQIFRADIDKRYGPAASTVITVTFHPAPPSTKPKENQ